MTARLEPFNDQGYPGGVAASWGPVTEPVRLAR
jgi:hypothetical protein